MRKGDNVDISGYVIQALIESMEGAPTYVVAHNESTHYLIFQVDDTVEGLLVSSAFRDGDLKGRYVAAFRYLASDDSEDDVKQVYDRAVELAWEIATGRAGPEWDLK